MPNGGPHGNHFQEAQWGWGYSEGFEAGYREAIAEVSSMGKPSPKRLAALLKRKFPEKEPPEIEDEASFLPSDVREWK